MTIVSALALFFVLLTMALVPVDVFIVTSMKDAEGNYKVSLVAVGLIRAYSKAGWQFACTLAVSSSEIYE